MSNISNNDIEKLQVSSTVKHDKTCGKQNIFDGNDDTCWSSDKGSPQWIWMEFKEPRTVSSFTIQFQGGFVGKSCLADFLCNDELIKLVFYPEDVNSMQKFTLEQPVITKKVKLTFKGSTDFFGRIIVYCIDFQ